MTFTTAAHAEDDCPYGKGGLVRHHRHQVARSLSVKRLGISRQEMSDWRKLNSISDEEFEEGLADGTVHDRIARARPVDPDDERKQQRWAATMNLITGILLFDRHKPGDGFEMAARNLDLLVGRENA